MAARRQIQKGPPELFVGAGLRYFCAVRARFGRRIILRGIDDELFLPGLPKLRRGWALWPWLNPELPSNSGQRRGGCSAAAAMRRWARALPVGPIARSWLPPPVWIAPR